MTRVLHALTIHQPWASCIARGWKPVENRDWPPPPQLFGQHLAIHAGKGWDHPALEDLHRDAAQLGIPDGELNSAMPSSCVLAVARLAGAVRVEPGPAGNLRATKVLGGLPGRRALDAARSPWARGLWLWVLEDVVAIDPVPCGGAQKVWRLPKDVQGLVLTRYAEATASRKAAP